MSATVGAKAARATAIAAVPYSSGLRKRARIATVSRRTLWIAS